MDELIAKIKEYLFIINPGWEDLDEDTLNFVINETLDRVQLYLNTDELPIQLARILANVINTNLKKCVKEQEISSEDVTEVEQQISSISDNGQSISYANEVKQYFSTTSDTEMFTGFTNLLSRYRRIKVVYPKTNEE